MAALASVIRAGGFERLREIKLCYNESVADEGACVFARAVEDAGGRGLPNLSKVDAVCLRLITSRGVAALAYALRERLETHTYSDTHQLTRGESNTQRERREEEKERDTHTQAHAHS